MYNYRVYNNLFGIFLIQMKYRLKSMYTHLFLMQLQAVYRKFKEKRKKNPYSRLWILHPKQAVGTYCSDLHYSDRISRF